MQCSSSKPPQHAPDLCRALQGFLRTPRRGTPQEVESGKTAQVWLQQLTFLPDWEIQAEALTGKGGILSPGEDSTGQSPHSEQRSQKGTPGTYAQNTGRCQQCQSLQETLHNQKLPQVTTAAQGPPKMSRIHPLPGSTLALQGS